MKKLLKNEKGQSMLEYVILTSLIGIFCIGGVKIFGERVKKRIEHINKQVVNHIEIS